MHIIAGKYKGKNLNFIKSSKIRPSQTKVREALFDILRDKVENIAFLDLCAGTGAMGLEALSRGAAKVVSVDLDVKLLYKNKQILPVSDQEKCFIFKQDAVNFLAKSTEKFDIIFFDPPWQSITLYKLALNSIIEFAILKPNGLLIVEHQKNFSIPTNFEFSNIKDYRYGDTILSFVSL